MANCPKCGYKLRFIDYKPECPECGVNLIYFNQLERLEADADKAEEEHIKMQPKIDRVKFSFAGTKLHIARLISLFIPIGMMFLPLVHINANLPFNEINTDVSILTLATEVIAKMEFASLEAIPMVAKICYFVSILAIFIAAIFAILSIPFVSVSSSEKGLKRNFALSSCGIIFTLISIISFVVFNSQVASSYGEMYSGNIGIGAFLVIVGFLIVIALNVIIKKKNVPVKYKDISEYIERIEKRKIEIAAAEARNEELRRAYQEQKAASKA